MQIVIPLGAPVLYLAQDRLIKVRAVQYLEVCRAACMEWLLQIHSSSNYPNKEKWQERSLAIAVICRQTFDVGPETRLIVFKPKRGIGDFVQCAACTYEYDPNTDNDESGVTIRRFADGCALQPLRRNLVY